MTALGGTVTPLKKEDRRLQRLLGLALPDEDIWADVSLSAVIARDLIWQTNNPAQDLWTPSRAFHLALRENKSR